MDWALNSLRKPSNIGESWGSRGTKEGNRRREKERGVAISTGPCGRSKVRKHELGMALTAAVLLRPYPRSG